MQLVMQWIKLRKHSTTILESLKTSFTKTMVLNVKNTVTCISEPAVKMMVLCSMD